MSFLALTLMVKIAMTGCLVVVPLLVASGSWLDRVAGASGAFALYRLYGVALLALLVGYGIALRMNLAGLRTDWVLPIGIVSNAGAALCLAFGYRGWLALLGVLFFATFAICLAAVFFRPILWMAPLW